MKRTNWLLLLILSGVTLLNISCKKDKTASSCSLTEANFAGSYKVQSAEYKQSVSSPEMDVTSILFKACQLDDITTFNANLTYIYTDAGTKCNPAGDATGTWALNDSTLTADGKSETIQDFSCSGFSASQSNVQITGDMITVTFIRQ